MKDWTQIIGRWKSDFHVKTFSPASVEALTMIKVLFPDLPRDLLDFYEITNGLVSEWFKILPIQDANFEKNTWDGLGRANDSQKSRFLVDSRDLFSRFIVFADLSGSNCACYEKDSGFIWYEDEDGIYQTDLELDEFIETVLKEVRDL